jgi:hypothetical protein
VQISFGDYEGACALRDAADELHQLLQRDFDAFVMKFAALNNGVKP